MGFNSCLSEFESQQMTIARVIEKRREIFQPADGFLSYIVHSPRSRARAVFLLRRFCLLIS